MIVPELCRKFCLGDSVGSSMGSTEGVTPQVLLRVSTPGLPPFYPLSHEDLIGQSIPNMEF
jgi:hypothetical protein